jgi:stalled ribosome rescue protein Dom34
LIWRKAPLPSASYFLEKEAFMKAPHIYDPYHCLVWIDHQIAHIYAVTHHDLAELAVIRAPDQGHGNVHHRAGTMGAGHEPISPEFMTQVTAALLDPAEILIAGPAQAKHALKDFIAAKAPAFAHRIVGVETLDKTGNGELHNFARRYFHHVDSIGAGTAPGKKPA